jgi:hypothetical protein
MLRSVGRRLARAASSRRGAVTAMRARAESRRRRPARTDTKRRCHLLARRLECRRRRRFRSCSAARRLPRKREALSGWVGSTPRSRVSKRRAGPSTSASCGTETPTLPPTISREPCVGGSRLASALAVPASFGWERAVPSRWVRVVRDGKGKIFPENPSKRTLRATASGLRTPRATEQDARVEIASTPSERTGSAHGPATGEIGAVWLASADAVETVDVGRPPRKRRRRVRQAAP